MLEDARFPMMPPIPNAYRFKAKQAARKPARIIHIDDTDSELAADGGAAGDFGVIGGIESTDSTIPIRTGPTWPPGVVMLSQRDAGSNTIPLRKHSIVVELKTMIELH